MVCAVTPSTPRNEPSLHLHTANWLKFTEALGLSTCLARAKALSVDRPHLSKLEAPTADGLSAGPVGSQFLAKVMLAMPKARHDFQYLFVPLSGAQHLARRDHRKSA
jgi:hypothetical protein